MTLELMLDVTNSSRPGADRGLGRYLSVLRDSVARMPNLRVEEYSCPSIGPARLEAWAEIPARALAARRHGGWFHATSVYQVPLAYTARTLVTILDLIPLELSEYRRTGIKVRSFYRLAEHCRAIVTLSAHGATRIVDLLSVDPGRVFVSPLPVRKPSSEPCGGCIPVPLPDRYVASLVDLRTPDPRKRAVWLYMLAALLVDLEIPMVILGAGTHQLNRTNTLGLGRLCDYHTNEVLGSSSCFVYTSAYEGQGLPPQEALNCGVPVVAFRNSSLPEMLGDGALWIDEPHNRSLDDSTLKADEERRVDELHAAVSRLLSNSQLRDELAHAGRAHVAQYTSERFYRGMQRFYSSAASV